MRPRLLTITLAAISAGVIGVSGAVTAQAATGPKAPRTVRVMSFNIHHGEGSDAALDLARIAAVIESQRPAVVGLQEVDRHWSSRSDFEDQASRLAELTRMHVVFGANLDLDPPAPDRPRRQFGNAILSRYPILNWDNTPLPRFEDHEQRGLLRAEIALPGRRLQVYNTHLQHNDAAERLAQAQAILSIMGLDGAAGSRRAPAILTGDFNAPPDTPEILTLTERLRDAWTGPGGFTHPSESPTHRIDYVMTTPDVRTRAVSVVADDPVASDHLPVVADLDVRRRGAERDT